MAELAVTTDPLYQRWVGKLLKKAKSTARVYSEFLSTYFSKVIRPRGVTSLQGWLDEVKAEQKSDDDTIKQRWGFELEEFATTYVSKTTGKGYTFKSRKLFVTAIRSFLTFFLGTRTLEPYNFDLQSSEERTKSEKQKEETPPIEPDEYRKLVLGAKSLRDRTILLTLASGMGTSEWLQFSQEWSKYAEQIRTKKAPIVVSLVRPKAARHYRVWLWDDAVEHLGLLLGERKISDKEPLFVSYRSEKGEGNVPVPLTAHRLQHMVRVLADSTGLEPKEKGRIIYRIRPHEIGRDFFRTLCENAEIPPTISEYLLGHKVDELEYNKFQNTEAGRARIEKALQKVRPYLNVVSRKGITPTTGEKSYFESTIENIAIYRGLDPEKRKLDRSHRVVSRELECQDEFSFPTTERVL